MARRIIRRRKVARPTQVKAEDVRPSAQFAAEARPTPSTRVMIAAPGSVSTVLSSKLSGSATVKVAAMTRDRDSAVEKVITEDVDVAAIFMRLGGEINGLDIARDVARACPEAGILIIIDNLDGVDLRRHARAFGTAWSYVTLASAEKDRSFEGMINGVGRGVHWVEPGIKRVLEAVWRVASEGRDLDMANALGELDEKSGPKPLIEPEPDPKPRGIQTMSTGNSGVGTSFGVRKAA